MINTLFVNPVAFLRYIVIIIISIVIHELAHGLAALSQGDDTPRVSGHMTLNPIVHMGWLSIIFLMMTGMAWGAMPVNPSRFKSPTWGDAMVSLAGPFSNLLLCTIGVLAMKLTGDAAFVSQNFFRMFAWINAILFVFNLLPIPPLDGFQAIAAFVPSLQPWRVDPTAMLVGFFLMSAVGVKIVLPIATSLLTFLQQGL
jgi:Zn-dependent protease